MGSIVLVEAQGQRSESWGELWVDMRVPATRTSVSDVRRAFGELPLPVHLLDIAQLLVSELVTNSIRHAGLAPNDQIRVTAEWSGTRLRVDVFDRAGVPVPHEVSGAIRPFPGAESGWGLYLVDRLAARWGRGRGRYWFELEAHQPYPASA